MFKSITAIILALSAPVMAQSIGDAANGETLFRKCSACHQVGEGAKNKVGPVLTEVVNRAAGSFDGYRYGRSMLAAGEAGLVWTPENIYAYLASPKDFLREFLDDPRAKAKMSFKMTDEQDRLDIVAYLSTFQMASAGPTNGFCVQNQSAETHFFAVDADGMRDLQELQPGETLCTAEADTPLNGFVSVFEKLDTAEGCSRLVTAGQVEGMVQYADFDRCEWSSHAG